MRRRPARRPAAPPASIPGSGELPPRNAADIAWSEYNHHWAGLFVLLMGGLALLNQAGVRWARHWPMTLLGLAVFLAIRSDPEVWPTGYVGVWESLRDVEVLQHRVFVLLIIVFAAFEWSVRTGRLRSAQAALVFPLLTAAGGALLLTHSPRDRQREGSVADRVDPHSPSPRRHRRRLGPLARTPPDRPRRADRRVGVAGVLPRVRRGADDLPRGLKRVSDRCRKWSGWGRADIKPKVPPFA